MCRAADRVDSSLNLGLVLDQVEELLGDPQLCDWFFLDRREAFTAGVAVGERRADTAKSDKRPEEGGSR
jgi:hypothetical protein